MLLDLWQSVSPYILPLYYVVILLVVFGLLLENRNPLKTHSYVLLLLFLPFIGIIIYLFFGQKFRKRKIFSKRRLINYAFGKEYIERYLDKGGNGNSPKDTLPQSFVKLINFLSQDLSPLSASNQVEILTNGEEKFPKLIEKLKLAKSHIHLEYYIYSEDDVGKEISEILIQKALAGIEVKLIVDGVGSFKLKKAFLRKLRKSGIEVHSFMPVLFPLFTSKINYRDHRKIVVIDGEIGFTGGINLDERYLNNGKHHLYWRDTHLMISGEGVKSLQFLFLLNWQFASGEELEPDKYFPASSFQGNHHMQINASGPDWDLASIKDSFFLAINSAKENIRIATPYFIPNESIMNAITVASKSGVDVEIMLPFVSDSWIVQSASMSFITKLLKNNVRVFLYKKGFLHAKTLTIDNEFSSVGSANMDYRSFDLNHEVNTYLYDKNLTQQLNAQFDMDRTDCVEINFEEWKNRKVSQKLQESLCRLLAPLL